MGPLLEELEPRVLLSADPLGAALVLAPADPEEAADDGYGEPLPGLDDPHGVEPPERTRLELVVVDTGVEDHETLLAALAADREIDVVLLDDGDGLEQVRSALLAAGEPYDALHLVAHGGEGRVHLGTSTLDVGALATHAEALRGWGEALSAQADILVYGCEVAAGEGRALVDGLAALTGADVAASDDLTGNAASDGDWALEYHAGAVEAATVLADASGWDGVLLGPTAHDDPGAYSAEVAALAPVGHWRLGESSGSTVSDSGANGLDGTYHGVGLGASDPIAGDPDTAASFDKVEGDYVEIPHDDAFLVDEGAIQLWFNVDDLDDVQALISKDSTGTDTGGHVYIEIDTDGSLETRLQGMSGDHFVTSSPSVVTPGQWHHVALTFGPDGMVLYLDGAVMGTNAYTGGLGTSSGGAGNYEPIAIGANTNLSDDGAVTPLYEFFGGRIDEVAIFSTQLGGADIARLAGAAMQDYTLTEDGSLTVTAGEGVLVNDYDPDGDPLTATLVSGPSDAASFSLGADGSFTYTPTPDFAGTDTFAYRANDGGNDSVLATATVTVTNVDDDPTGTLTIDDATPTQGQTLTASDSIADADGIAGPITYQWQRDGVDVATGASYLTAQDDVGATLRVVASYTDGFGAPELVASASTAAVGNVNDLPTGTVVIDDATPTEGQVLTASDSIADLDGLSGAITYQWQRDGVDVATGVTYLTGGDDVGAALRIVATYTDDFGAPESVVSAPTAPVAGVNEPPTGLVSIDDATPMLGDVLHAANTLADGDGLSGTIGYRWQRDGVDIPGATGASYSIAATDIGASVTVVASYTDDGGTFETVASAPTAAVIEPTTIEPPPPTPTGDNEPAGATAAPTAASGPITAEETAGDVALARTQTGPTGGPQPAPPSPFEALPDAPSLLSAVEALAFDEPERERGGAERSLVDPVREMLLAAADPAAPAKAPAVLETRVETGIPHDVAAVRVAIEQMGLDIDETIEEETRTQSVLTASSQIALGTLSAGYLTWALRAGSMLATVASYLPVWTRFDPLPVLTRDPGDSTHALEATEEIEEVEREAERRAGALLEPR